jgi:cytochrome c-type biogenesis protein CcmH
MSALALAIMVLPLRRGANRGQDAVASETERADGSAAVLVDQLDEVARDRERGLISPAEAQAAEIEIKRRLLLAGRAAEQSPKPARSGGRAALIAVALAVPAFAAGYYALSGNPGTPSLPFAARDAERAGDREIVEATQRLRERLVSDPEGGPSEGWILLGRTYLKMGRYDAAAEAFETVTERDDAPSSAFSLLAETLIVAENGVVTPRARRAAAAALERDPANPAGTYYTAMALSQQGDEAAAHDLLVARLDAGQEPQPWMGGFVAEANRLAERLDRAPLDLAAYVPQSAAPAPGPSAADVAAADAMSDTERGAFIRSMVERLATRLEEEPDDLDGWLRLGNAYRVLDERDAARNAYETAAALLSDMSADDPRQDLVRQALEDLGGAS